MDISGWAAVAVVISSLSWSLFDSSRKKLSLHFTALSAVFWLMLLQAPLFVLYAVSVTSERWLLPASDYWWPAGLSLALNVLSSLWFIDSVRLAPLSLAIPLLSLTPVFSSLGGYLILNESISLRAAAGIAVIVASTSFLGWKTAVHPAKTAKPGIGGALEKAKIRRGLLLMLGVALLFALIPVFDKVCLGRVPMSEHASLQCLAVAVAVAVVIFWKSRGRESLGFGWSSVKTHRLWLLFAVVFAAFALGAQFAAIRNMPVAFFEAFKRSLGLVFSLAFGRILFGEAVTFLKVAIIGLIALGVFFLLT